MERLPITQSNPNTVRIRAAEPTDAAAISALIGGQGWEQGQREPAGAAKTLLAIAQIIPEALLAVA